MLSPNFQEWSTILLERISHQLDHLPTGNTTSLPPFFPGSAVIMVNILWGLSLLTSLTSAFYQTMAQEWLRKCNELMRNLQIDQAGTRMGFLIRNVKWRIRDATALTVLPLHFSFFLFFSGLLVFLCIGGPKSSLAYS